MMKLLKLYLLFAVLCPFIIRAQDTLKIMHQNTMYYGVPKNFVYPKDLSVKNAALKTVFQYAKPDILTLNEVSPDSLLQDSLVNTTLNVDGITYYKKAPTTNIAQSEIVNVVFYNSQKVALYSSEVAQNVYRDINVYTFYHLNHKLKQGDTTFFTCMVAHLKSSESAADKRARDTMVTNALNYLNTKSDTLNLFFMGDFNLYTSTEPAFQTMINYPNENIRLYDPINQMGKWQDDPAFAIWHTQSPRTTSSGSGGLDDRFDFIMINRFVKDGSRKIKYIADSYKAIGNDGNHLNKALNDLPINTLYPMDVVNAIVAATDHLPVSLLVALPEKTMDIPVLNEKRITLQLYPNAAFDILNVQLLGVLGETTITFFNVAGKQVLKKKWMNTEEPFEVSLSHLKQGTYVVKVSGNWGYENRKIIKK